MDVAEDEARDAVADSYEEDARGSEDPSESLDDIDYSEAEEDSTPAELAAMHEDDAAGEEE